MTTKIYTDEEIDTMLGEMGLRRFTPTLPFWKRWKCRVMGPHSWAPIQQFFPDTGAFVEMGRVCTVCHKERM